MHKPKGKGRNIEQKQAAALQRKPSRREKKGDPQAGQRGRLFAAGLSVAACFSCSARLETAGAVAFRLILGVSLSAAARSAAALVYDKLTPNCHPVLEGYMKIGSHFISGCLYVCMKFCGISEFAVQRIVPLPNARFPVVYRASADSQFRAYFCLPHTVHIAI